MMESMLNAGTRLAAMAVSAALLLLGPAPSSQAQPTSATTAPQRLRIVGGLANVRQYTHFEAPFWNTEFEKLTKGKLTADIVPFDQAGLRGADMLRLVQLGAVPFGNALLSLVATQDLELGAPDLAGVNSDMPTLRRTVAAFRPYLEKRLRERWGVELLAIYVYPAQVTFCAKPFASLADLKGRRVRTSNVMQSDMMEALGATPVQIPFAEIVSSIRAGSVDCAITGTMSGNTIGLHEVTRSVSSMALQWGLSVFVVNSASFHALPPEIRALLKRELPRLEKAIWESSERETGEGLACNSGAPSCVYGQKGSMTVVKETPGDVKRRRDVVVSTVLPRWVQRCGPQCAVVWNNTLKPVTGIEADSRRP